jgi:hypothetical protein
LLFEKKIAASIPDPKLAAHLQQMKIKTEQEKKAAKSNNLTSLALKTDIEVIKHNVKSKVPVAAALLKDPLRDKKEIADLTAELK